MYAQYNIMSQYLANYFTDSVYNYPPMRRLAKIFRSMFVTELNRHSFTCANCVTSLSRCTGGGVVGGESRRCYSYGFVDLLTYNYSFILTAIDICAMLIKFMHVFFVTLKKN